MKEIKDKINNKAGHWYKIKWEHVIKYVENQQNKIVVAYRVNDKAEVFRLQNELIKSWAGRAFAVRKTTSTSGGKTPGIDQVTWKTPQEKWAAITELQKITQDPTCYRAKPVKKVMIPKPNQVGKERPLGIPVQIDRAMQNLILLTLDPIIEETSDLYSFGFRKFRSPGLAMARIRFILDKRTAPQYLWDADIKGCFDNISFDAVRDALDGKLSPVGINYIEKWLNSGIIFEGKTTWPTKGIPQGGVISPVLMNAVLNGMENCIRGENVSWEHKTSQKEFNSLKNCWVIRYADDFIVTSANKLKLEEEMIPKIKEFLKNRGLEINAEKSTIIDLHESGFYFLGWEVTLPIRNWRLNKLGGHARTFVMRPMKLKVKNFKAELKKAWDPKHPMSRIVAELNPKIRGWTNYYRTSYHSQRDFQHLTTYNLENFYNWGRRKHSSRTNKWLRDRYIFRTPTRKWVIGNSEKELLLVPNESTHWDLRSMKNLNPYTDQEYFVSRNIHLTAERLRKTVYINYNFRCALCNGPLAGEELIEIHHIKAIKDGGKSTISNLAPLHETCHKSVTYAGVTLKGKDLFNSD